MGYIWQDLYLTTDLSSAKYSVLLPVYLPDLYSVPKSFPYAKSLHRAIICNTIRFYLMYKSLYNRNIYFQILTMQNNLIPSTGWITEFKYFQISANNRICVPNDPCLRWEQVDWVCWDLYEVLMLLRSAGGTYRGGPVYLLRGVVQTRRVTLRSRDWFGFRNGVVISVGGG